MKASISYERLAAQLDRSCALPLASEILPRSTLFIPFCAKSAKDGADTAWGTRTLLVFGKEEKAGPT
jgi:hypothetical protein